MPSGSRRRRGGPRSSTTGHNPQASVENRQGLNWEIWAVGTFSVLLLGFPAKGKRVISLKDTVRLLFLNRFSMLTTSNDIMIQRIFQASKLTLA